MEHTPPQTLSKFWIREASMKRVNMLVRNKAESLGEVFLDNEIKAESLEPSGLSEIEVSNLEKWVTGLQSGRQCMVAIAEHQLAHRSADDKGSKLAMGVLPRPTEFRMLSSTLCLPDDFLCDSGYLYDNIFQHPPLVVVREAMDLLREKAMEKNLSSLRTDQINLALKQLRIDNLRNDKINDSEDHENKDVLNHQDMSRSGKRNEKRTVSDVSPDVSSFRLSVLIELIRIHIKRSAAKNAERGSATLAAEEGRRHLHSRVSASSASQTVDAAAVVPSLDIQELVEDLETPLDEVIRRAEAISPDALETTNMLLKPYIRQLSSLKASLSTQLKNFEDSRAYISLGVSTDATEEAIKKAYRAKAIQLHPDKPGGDTAKFQALQVSYQEILEKRRAEAGDSGAAERVALDPKVQAENRDAREILDQIVCCLDQIQQAANDCTLLGQRNIQFLRAVEAASGKLFPENYNELLSLLEYTYDEKEATKKKKKKSSKKSFKKGECHDDLLSVDMQMCCPSSGVGHLEAVSEATQRLSALAMQLPACGFRFGLATAIHSSYMKTVEGVMACGLSAIKLVPSLLTVEDGIITCQQKIQDCKMLHLSGGTRNDSTMHRVVVEMILMAFKGAARAVSAAAEKCVDSAIVAAELYNIASTIVETGEKEAVAEERRAATRREKEEEMCDEDLREMAERNRQDRADMAKAMQAEEEERRRKAEKDKEEEDDATVEVLRVKIRSLQVQLRVQHIQALQSLNNETKTLQQQLQRQLRELVKSSVESDTTAAEIRCQREKEKKQQEIDRLKAELEQSGFKGVSATDLHSNPLKAAPPLKLSLFSLLAEFIDSSSNALREELGSGKVLESCATVLRKHLGWMHALIPAAPKEIMEDAPAVGGSSSAKAKSKVSTVDSKPSLHDIDDETDEKLNSRLDDEEAHSDCSEQPPASSTSSSKRKIIRVVSETGPRLALLPDYRSKTLWLASLVDEEAVCSMVRRELSARLASCFSTDELEGKFPNTATEVGLFCEGVVVGVQAVVSGLQSENAMSDAK